MESRIGAGQRQFPDHGLLGTRFAPYIAIARISHAHLTHHPSRIPVSRYFRGAHYGGLGGGTSEMLRNLGGKTLLEQMNLATGVLDVGMF